MSTPLVTVVMPNFNYGHFITEAMESVVAQTCRDWELIVVDDNSTDGSREIVAAFIDSHPGRHIRLLHNRRGPSGTPTPVNIGIAAMRGEYFAWLSSDDAFEPMKLERQIAALERHPSAALAHTGYVRVDENGDASGSFHPPTEFEAGAFAALLDGNFINGNTVLIPRRVLEEFGPFLETDAEIPELWRAAEYYHWLRVTCRHPIVAIDEPLHRSRIHGGNRDINLGTVFPALERVFIRRLFDREPVAATPAIVRALAGRGLASLALRCADTLEPSERELAVRLLSRLERGQDVWDLGRYAEARDLDRDRIRTAFRGSPEMLRAVAGLERTELEPYRAAARRRVAGAA